MVRAIMIVEMAGRPAEHLTASLEKHVKVLRDITDIKVHTIKVSLPQEIPRPKNKQVAKDEIMFSAFAECDFETDNFSRLTQTMFDFMPSSVEVVEPFKITMESSEATDLLNNISGRLHRYDDFAKVANEKMKFMNEQILKGNEIIKTRNAEIAELKSNISEINKKPIVRKIEKKDTNKKNSKKAKKKKVTKKNTDKKESIPKI